MGHLSSSDKLEYINGWIEVPSELEYKALQYLPWVNLIIEDGILVDIEEDTDSKEAWEQVEAISNFQSLKEEKLKEISEIATTTIMNGITVTLTDGTEEKLSLTEKDQINLMVAKDKIKDGAPFYPYHADGQICRLYDAADIVIIVTAAEAHILYHTTYCNHLFMWIRRMESIEELETVFYGIDLPEDLAESMTNIMLTMSNLE